jgi:hypothetical protein
MGAGMVSSGKDAAAISIDGNLMRLTQQILDNPIRMGFNNYI